MDHLVEQASCLFGRAGWKRCSTTLRGLTIFFLPLLTTHAPASDWPQFLGPTRDGVYAGAPLAEQWSKEGPRVVWQKKVGEGHSGPAVAAGKVILFHRLGDRETVECLDAATGKPAWSFDYATDYSDSYGSGDGPRATPTIADGKVFTFGPSGLLHCLDFASGKKVWSHDTQREFGARLGFFGLACSPLVEGNAVLLNAGGADGAGIVAFDKDTGKLLWKATDHEASYASPVAATLHGQRLAVFFTRAGLVGTTLNGGEIRFQFPWRSRMSASVNAATPLVIGYQIFLSASYGTGAALLRVKPDYALEKVWSGDDVLSAHYATPVHLDGFLYGIDGRVDPGFPPAQLRCVELQTGKVRWSEDFGAATVTLAGKHLLLLKENGELLLALPTPDKFTPRARAQILGGGARAHPALADGFLYARSREKLVCVDLRKR
ncbi:MAG: PQQ-like beta-propeller repeat protein [Pedosphaera parvula]|nr:PQQ-like beta-propeller repeat protein [Pedosphaera parvula]